ncbi:MAG: hypothetical protein H6729_03110 [Deltaproteobacteria bacterium]|nr:hypothetical protein [Deltaproteobacteria bacterium]
MKPWSRFGVVFVCLTNACASTLPPPMQPTPPASSSSPPSGTFDDERGPVRVRGRSDVDLALEASGLSEGEALNAARQKLEATIASVITQVRPRAPSVGDEPYDVGRRLLAALHGEGGPLRDYDARATTLAEILDAGRFNCVSASVLFNLIARRLDLNVGAELLPTHARSLLYLPALPAKSVRRIVVVETTSSLGFDPDERQLSLILEGVVGNSRDSKGSANSKETKEEWGHGRRTMIASGGVRVKTRVLIGTIYVNRASIAQEAGDLALAERLFGKSEAFAKAGPMQQVLRDQRAVLLSQLAADDVLSGVPERLERALSTLIDAAALAPHEPRILRAVRQNLRAAAERRIASAADDGDERGIDRVLKRVLAVSAMADARDVGAALRAFAASETGRLLAARQDYEGALRVIQLGLQEPIAQEDASLRETLTRNQVAVLRLTASGFARHGAFAAAWHHLRLIDDISGLSKETRDAVDEDRRRVVHVAAEQLIESNDLEHAAEVYRAGLRRFPAEKVYRHNLVAVLERLAAPIVSGQGCLEATPLLDEIHALDRRNTFPARSKVHCLLKRAEERLRAKDFDEALALVERARERAPEDEVVAKNLALVLLKTARMLPRPRGCKRARMLLRQARALKVRAVPEEAFLEATERCR